MAEAKKTAKKAAPKKTELETVTIQTSHGFEVEVDKAVFDDFEVFELIAEIAEKDNGFKIPALFRKLFADKSERVLEMLKERNNGRAPLSVCIELVFEVVNAQDPNA